MSFSLGVVLFAIAIGLSIALHEFGHLLSAKAFGMKATQYFIGFGPTLFSFRRGETEYGLKAIPAGGFVKIIGMTPAEEDAGGTSPAGPHSGWNRPPPGLGAGAGLPRRPAVQASAVQAGAVQAGGGQAGAGQSRAFWRYPAWKRVTVLSAGSAMHFLIALVAFYGVAVTTGLPTDKAIVGDVQPCVVSVGDTDGSVRDCQPGDATARAAVASRPECRDQLRPARRPGQVPGRHRGGAAQADGLGAGRQGRAGQGRRDRGGAGRVRAVRRVRRGAGHVPVHRHHGQRDVRGAEDVPVQGAEAVRRAGRRAARPERSDQRGRRVPGRRPGAAGRFGAVLRVAAGRVQHLRRGVQPVPVAPAGRRAYRDRAVRGGPLAAGPGVRPGRPGPGGLREADAADHAGDSRLRQHLAAGHPGRHRQPDCQPIPVRTVIVSAVPLGMPAPPPPTLAARRRSRQIRVGSVLVGGDAPVSVQSMTTTPTTDVDATLQQIAALTATGCQIVRVAVPSQDDAGALPAIARKSQIPVIADIHFQPKYVFAAIDAGCAAVRVNPGNIKAFDDKVAEIARAGGQARIPIRIGVNAGSLDPRLLAKHGKATPEALVESALWECSLFEEHDFREIKISVKHHDPVVMIEAYRQLADRCDYPLHLGVTEAGPAFQGTIKSAVAFGSLLADGIGDTIRVSLSAPPVEEVKVGIAILEALGLRQRGLEIVSCPSCGRAQVDVYTLADQVTAGLEGLEVPLRVAVMGCVVNGPGEAREADLGVASGNGKGQIFVRGEVIKTVPESQIVETLIEEAMKLAATIEGGGGESGPEVAVF